MEEQQKKYFKTISFNRFEKWYVSYYLNPHIIQSNFKLVKLSEIIYPIKERIRKNDYDGSLSVVSKISFRDGTIHLREEKKTGMDLYVLDEKALLISKINFHQGAVAINSLKKLVCSTHYQPYKINKSKFNSLYLTLTLRSNPFLNFIKYLRADGIKNEAGYEFIGGLEIPLPSLTEQNRLVAAYNNKKQKAQEQEKRAMKLEKEIEEYLYKVLGLKRNGNTSNSKSLNTISFVNISRWAVDYISKYSSIEAFLDGKYESVCLGDFMNSFQYGLSEKSVKEPIGIPMLRMNNIYDSELSVDNLKYIQIDNKTKDKYLLNKGDLLFNRTNSKELVGKTAIFNEDVEYTFASYIIRVKLNQNSVNTEYINYLFNSSVLQYQKDMISRKTLGQANINSKEMQDFLFPLPSLKVQNEIAKTITQMKAEINELKKQAQNNRHQAINDFENEIFN